MKVSIITVAYNSAETLGNAMSSVLGQTYNDIEYIVVDGLSTDDTIDVIRSFEPKFRGRLRWSSEKDNGIYDAMNKGVRMATGDVVGILNSDDFLTSNDVIERVASVFNGDSNLDLVYGNVHFVDSRNPRKNIRNYTGRFFRPWTIRFGFFPPHPSIYVRKELYDRYGYYDDTLRISADFEFFANLVHNHHVSMRFLNMDFVTMLTGGESTRSLSQRRLGTKEDIQACRKLGIRTNGVFIRMKYLFKAFDAIIPM